jgi:thioredoxin-like negative regulator of GroEL
VSVDRIVKKMCAYGMAETDVHGVAVVGNEADWTAVMGRGTVIVLFHAKWCPHCVRISPYFAELSAKFKSLLFASVDADDASSVVKKYGVGAYPTFQVWKDGCKVDERLGANREQLREFVERNAA